MEKNLTFHTLLVGKASVNIITPPQKNTIPLYIYNIILQSLNGIDDKKYATIDIFHLNRTFLIRTSNYKSQKEVNLVILCVCFI